MRRALYEKMIVKYIHSKAGCQFFFNFVAAKLGFQAQHARFPQTLKADSIYDASMLDASRFLGKVIK